MVNLEASICNLQYAKYVPTLCSGQSFFQLQQYNTRSTKDFTWRLKQKCTQPFRPTYEFPTTVYYFIGDASSDVMITLDKVNPPHILLHALFGKPWEKLWETN